MDLNGGNPKQLTNGGNDFGTTLTLDSKWVIYSSDMSGNAGLMRVSIDGGNEVQLTEYTAGNPELSPDGKLIACQYRENANSPWRYAIVPSDGASRCRSLICPRLPTRIFGGRRTDALLVIYVQLAA